MTKPTRLTTEIDFAKDGKQVGYVRIPHSSNISAYGWLGVPIAQIGLWQPTDPLALKHQAGTLFDGGEVEPVEGSRIYQGFLEDSNVNPVSEIARMIEVQRAYELGQKFLDAEDGRMRGVIETLGR